MAPMFSDSEGDFLLYDGECPFCSAYVRMQRLRAAGVKLTLLDARQEPEKVATLARHGLDINQGMFLKFGKNEFFGADVMNAVALMTGPTGALNRLTSEIFRHRSLARVLYPALRAGRNLTLRLIGRDKIAVRQ